MGFLYNPECDLADEAVLRCSQRLLGVTDQSRRKYLDSNPWIAERKKIYTFQSPLNFLFDE